MERPKLDPTTMSDDELLALVTLLGGRIIARDKMHPELFGYEWLDGLNIRTAKVMRGTHITERDCMLDFLALKEVIDGPTNGYWDEKL